MRVLLLGPVPPEPGGVAAHVRDLALALAAGGHIVTVLARRYGPQDGEAGPLLPHDIRLLRLPDSGPHRLRWLALLRREGLRHDVVHAHTFRLGYLASLALPEHIPLVFTVHAYFSAEMAAAGTGPAALSFYKYVERHVLRRAHAVVAVDRGRARWARQVRGCGGVIELPNCLWLPDYPPPDPVLAERRWELACPRPLHPRYGVEHAIHALAILKRYGLQMAIMGDGPLRTSLASLCRQLGLEECVSFLGKLPRWTVIERLKGAAATLVPSVPWQGDEEATSIAALESMAVGTPVVASRSGGLAEIIEDGTTGVLVEPGNPRAIAAGVRGLLTDPTRWRRIALRAREYIEKEHDWARAVTVLEQIYWQVTPT